MKTNTIFNKKEFWFVISLIILFLVIEISSFFYPFAYQIGRLSDEAWTETQTFSLDYSVQLEKSPTKDFVVLNLADVQLSNISFFNGDFSKAKTLITTLINDKNPDLITLTGDNIAGLFNYRLLNEFTTFIDSFNIPWAPVMGNHDDDGSGDYNWVADTFLNSNNCVLKKGPSELGVGNYVITITENSQIIEALILMDTHSSHIWDSQKVWYSWVINGLNALAGYTVDTTLMFHIPLVEYDDAWNYWVDSGYNESIGIGEKNETVCSDSTNNGFFALIKNLQSTKNVICGHDHLNTYSILYEGIRLTYAIKSSEGSYFNENILGGTVLSINSTNVNIEQYIP